MLKILMLLFTLVLVLTDAYGGANDIKNQIEKGNVFEESGSEVGNEHHPILQLNLEDSVRIALENNRQRKITSLAVEIAETQYKQAMSSYWPSFNILASQLHFDEEPDFIFSGSGLNNIKVKLTNRDITSATFNGFYPVYTGGMRPAIVKQAEMGLEISGHDKRRTDLQIVYDVNRMYYSVVLTRKLLELGNEILEHFEAILLVTESFYKSGSISVNKTDYLKLKIMVNGIRAYLATIESNFELSKAGLVNTLGVPFETEIEITEDSLPYAPMDAGLKELVSSAYEFSPDWKKLNAAIKAMNALVKERKSGYYPKLVLSGRLFIVDSSFDAGLTSDANSDGYTVSLHMQLPVFSGYYTKNRVREACLKLKTIEEQKILLKEGLAIQIKHVFILLNRHNKEILLLKDALSSSEENRKLNMAAYEDEIVELKSVTESLIIEALVKARYYSAMYSHLDCRAKLDYIIGKEMLTVIGMNN